MCQGRQSQFDQVCGEDLHDVRRCFEDCRLVDELREWCLYDTSVLYIYIYIDVERDIRVYADSLDETIRFCPCPVVPGSG